MENRRKKNCSIIEKKNRKKTQEKRQPESMYTGPVRHFPAINDIYKPRVISGILITNENKWSSQGIIIKVKDLLGIIELSTYITDCFKNS